ncbi:DUF192 domain-containing protein [Lacibacterium aquatile]|uniref:DUF192 domain-containing protein n=1 Tax=Lacibacterium aquatile TaxID=1168082 RepID=A0ABW5DRK9_9PROT
MSQITRLFVFLALVLSPLAASAQAVFPRDSLAIESGGKRVTFQVELAESPEQRAQGLMYRKSMAPDAGMLFVEPGEREQLMWMKNTLIPLDMLFIRADGTIHSIHERAVPRSEATIASRGAVKSVLELNGGTVSRLGIKPGDKVIYKAFGTK